MGQENLNKILEAHLQPQDTTSRLLTVRKRLENENKQRSKIGLLFEALGIIKPKSQPNMTAGTEEEHTDNFGGARQW